MPANTIVLSGGNFQLYGSGVEVFDSLPVGTYNINFNPMTGYSLVPTTELIANEAKVYGNTHARVDRISRSFDKFTRSLGVLLSGPKGMGKSLMLRILAERFRAEHNLPTVIVSSNTPGLASFLDDIGESVIVFDEFEKIFPKTRDDNAQDAFLSLFDGMSTTKRLYVLSVNDLDKVSDFMKNRPGRFHYHMEFTYPDPDVIAEYLRENVDNITDDNLKAVTDFSSKVDLNFDHLRAIAFELSMGYDLADCIDDLNIKRDPSTFRDPVFEVTVKFKGDDPDDEHVFDTIIDLLSRKPTVSVEDYANDFYYHLNFSRAVENSDGDQVFNTGAFKAALSSNHPGGFDIIKDYYGEDNTPKIEYGADITDVVESITIKRSRPASNGFSQYLV